MSVTPATIARQAGRRAAAHRAETERRWLAGRRRAARVNGYAGPLTRAEAADIARRAYLTELAQ